MKTITFGLSRPIKPTLFSRLIMWAEGTDYSHTYIKWPWAAVDRDIVYQASKMAVNFESGKTFYGHSLPVKEYDVDLSLETYKLIMQFCMDNSNKPYSLKQIAGFTYVKLAWKIFKKRVHNPFPTHGSSFVCSKIAAEIADKIPGIEISSSYDDITPLDFECLMEYAVAKGLARRRL